MDIPENPKKRITDDAYTTSAYTTSATPDTKVTIVTDLPGAFQRIGTEIGNLVEEKNKAYGSSFSESGKIMRILYPRGIQPDQMTDALLVLRIIDKLFRIANEKDAFGESPFRDICGYGICGASIGK